MKKLFLFVLLPITFVALIVIWMPPMFLASRGVPVAIMMKDTIIKSDSLSYNSGTQPISIIIESKREEGDSWKAIVTFALASVNSIVLLLLGIKKLKTKTVRADD